MVMYMVKTPSWPVDLLKALLDRIREETGMSQAQLAALVPMDQSQLSRWRGGSSRPRFESLVALGNALRGAHPTLDIGPEEFLVAAGYETSPTENSDSATVSQGNAAKAESADQLATRVDTLLRQQEELINEVRGLRAQVDDLRDQQSGNNQGESGIRASA